MDKYRIDALIGSGGMGNVVRASHLHLHQPVAIKLLLTGRLPFAGESYAELVLKVSLEPALPLLMPLPPGARHTFRLQPGRVSRCAAARLEGGADRARFGALTLSPSVPSQSQPCVPGSPSLASWPRSVTPAPAGLATASGTEEYRPVP